MARKPDTARAPGGRFAPGNPGKAKGTRHLVTRAVEQLIEGESNALTRKAIDMALAGDTVALRLCLERLAPARRERTVEVDIPPVATATDHPAALAALLSAVAAGEITPSEAQGVAGVMAEHRRSIETVEIIERLERLEGTAR